MKIHRLFFLSAICSILLFSCGGGEPAEPKWKKSLSNANMVELGILSPNPLNNQVLKLRNSNDVDILKKLVKDEEAVVANCGYSGAITYYNDTSKLLSLKFSVEENCVHVSIDEDGKTMLKKMTPEGESFLKNLIRLATQPHLAGLGWMEGSWVRYESDGVSTEWWGGSAALTNPDDKVIIGGSYTLKDNDTVFSEKLKIEQDVSGIFYVADVKENAAPVKFKLTKFSYQKVVFENHEHDWPQKISYRMIGSDTLFARVEGPIEDGKKNYHKDYVMKRVKPNL